jgi:hypothetical protein
MNTHRTFKEFISEQPQINPKDVNPLYVKKYLIKPIQKALNKNSFEKEKENIFSHITHTYSLFVVSETFPNSIQDIIGGVLLQNKKVNGIEVLQEKCSKKFIDDYPNMVLEIFRLCSEGEEIIMSDSVHSKKMSNIWKKWIENPKKYEIEIVNILDVETNEKVHINDVWGYEEKYQDVRILAKFH